ncbi:MAG: GMC family oxidoreductase N-terminal domain-containing protein [Candidatus Saccharibacteria bacterium]|nr:GMC family oxidoreductase N-terminal domain-containing protein [Pseudorhodobacter sp.]
MGDFIVVGAGSAGAVVAARLAEAGAQVTLIGAGAKAHQVAARVPGLYYDLMDTELDWGFRTVPQPELNNRRIFLTRGKGLGGTSLMNAMVYMRGNRGDYDGWRDLGNAGWGFDDVLPLFKRSETNQARSDAYHGKTGGLIVTDQPNRNPMTSLFLDACAQNQLRWNDDVNGESQEGYGPFQMTADARGRCHTDRAFLDPVKHLPNLRIITNALVTRVIIADGRAQGVEFVSGSQGHRALADEVILCGGALNSPQLLMLSGIGPAAHLAAQRITVAADRPGVGQNLQDHLQVGYRCQVDQPLSLYGMTGAEAQAAVAAFLADGSGPYASNFCEAGAFLRLGKAETYPDVQVHFEPDYGPDRTDGSVTDRHGFGMWINVSRPQSRGEIRLRSADPFDKPAVDPRYLSEPADLALTVDAVLACREIGTAPAFQQIGVKEMWPGEMARSRADIERFVRTMASTIWHPCGSCKMGVDDMAVVGPDLRVHGVAGLRVADASIMPTIVSANTNATCIMIGEKAADLSLQ